MLVRRFGGGCEGVEMVVDFEDITKFLAHLAFEDGGGFFHFCRRVSAGEEAWLGEDNRLEDGESVLTRQHLAAGKDGTHALDDFEKGFVDGFDVADVSTKDADAPGVRDDCNTSSRTAAVGVGEKVAEIPRDFSEQRVSFLVITIDAVDFALLVVDFDFEFSKTLTDEFEGLNDDFRIFVKNSDVVHVSENDDVGEPLLDFDEDWMNDSAEEERTESGALANATRTFEMMSVFTLTHVEVGVFTIFKVEETAEGGKDGVSCQGFCNLGTERSVEGIFGIDGESEITLIDEST